MKKKLKLYLTLFTSTFYLSAFTFGGGYVIIPLMKKRFVDNLHWLEEEEMLNLTAIAQSSPGAVAVNAAILLGWRVAGIVGAAISILGTVLPPLLILSALSVAYTAFRDNQLVQAVLHGMQAGIVAVIADVVWTMGQKIVAQKKAVSIFIMLGAFVANCIFKVNLMLIILACGALGALTGFLDRKGAKQE